MKKYLIFGGSSGIGFEVAKKITEQGDAVVVVAHNPEKLLKAYNQLEGQENHYISFDLNDVEHLREVFLECHKKNIVFDGMIYCAGIAPLCLLKDNSYDLMNRVFSVNIFSFVEAVKFFQMEEYSKMGSKIVVVSSITASGSGYRQVLYGASKAALSAAVKLAAKELYNRKIVINSVAPGVCDTAILDDLKANSENLECKIKNNQFLGIIPPEKVADVILFLLSPIAEYISGVELLYDGGSILK